MDSQSRSIEDISQPIIVQCRCEIEIGWQHVEAARAVLRRSQWLLARWNSSRSAWAEMKVPIVPKPDMFVTVEPETLSRRRLRRPDRGLRQKAAGVEHSATMR